MILKLVTRPCNYISPLSGRSYTRSFCWSTCPFRRTFSNSSPELYCGFLLKMDRTYFSLSLSRHVSPYPRKGSTSVVMQYICMCVMFLCTHIYDLILSSTKRVTLHRTEYCTSHGRYVHRKPKYLKNVVRSRRVPQIVDD